MNDLDATLRDLPAPTPPAISAEMEALLGALEPVPMRNPARDLAKVAGVSLTYGAALVVLLSMRRDMDSLPLWWIATIAIAWFVGFATMLYVTVMPRAGAVMPRWRVAGIGAVVVGIGFVAAGLMMDPMSPESRVLGLDRVHHGHFCLELGLATALVPVLLGALVLRGAMPVGSRWTAAGLGAAGGSLGGLVLHLHCPIADGWHLGLVHGGVVVVAALLSAAIVPRFGDRSGSPDARSR